MNEIQQGVIRDALQRLLQLFEELVPLEPQAKVVGGPIDWLKGGAFDLFLSLIAPPDLDDGPAVRAWLLKMLGWVDRAATLTSTGLDNTAVGILAKCVKSDDLWPDLYALLHSLPHDCDHTVMMDSPNTQTVAARLGEKVGVDPFTIVSIVLAIIRIIISLKK